MLSVCRSKITNKRPLQKKFITTSDHPAINIGSSTHNEWGEGMLLEGWYMCRTTTNITNIILSLTLSPIGIIDVTLTFKVNGDGYGANY